MELSFFLQNTVITNPIVVDGTTNIADEKWHHFTITYDWPTVKAIDPNSFMTKSQAKNGLNFYLPAEVESGYSCRPTFASHT
jgi:hypothetical protein